MFAGLSLKLKLTVASVILVVVPVIIIGTLSIQQLRQFGKDTSQKSFTALEKQTLDTLESGVGNDRQLIMSLLELVENDTKKLAVSSNMISYLESVAGENEVLNQLAQKEVLRIVEGVIESSKVQQRVLEKKLKSDLDVIERLIFRDQTLQNSTEMNRWKAVNQLTKQVNQLDLPLLKIGGQIIAANDSFKTKTPIVDEAQSILGGTCTIFQVMNKNGDMLRVATNVKKLDGTRAIGTYIPAVNPDGSTNAVIASVKNGQTFLGRAFVVNAWYFTAYKPLYDTRKNLIGMLYVGIREDEITADLVKAILSSKIGRSGYLFVLNDKGDIQYHPRSELVGKNVVTDLNLSEFTEIFKTRRAGEIKTLSYQFENRNKFLMCSYMEQWNWIICGSGYWDEFSQDAATVSIEMLKKEIMAVYHSGVKQIDGNAEYIYNQIRYVDENGHEIIKLNKGGLSDNLESVGGQEWFQSCRSLAKGQVYNSGVIQTSSSPQAEVIIASSVLLKETAKGLVVFNMDWPIVWKLLKAHIYGKTGYPYVVNSNGLLISHPKYTLRDKMDLSDPKNGAEMAAIVRDRMLKGDKGADRYAFEGLEKFVAFAPLPVGNQIYSIVGTGPADEFLGLAEVVKSDSEHYVSNVTKLIACITLLLVLAGSGVGLLISNYVVKPLIRVIKGLSDGSGQINAASGEILSASQSLADGVSEQAASLEEISSSLEQMTAMTKQNSDNANQANVLMTEASRVVADANGSMKHLISAMEEISSASQETQKIVKTIDEIAFQTNLLALNAAVEAARAGEAGAGFAVVAGEVRNLAIRSAEAAKTTSDLIDGTVKKINQGSSLVRETGEAFFKVTSSTSKAGELVSEIAAASEEQAQGIAQVNESVSQMDSVVQQNSANSEESASASKQLSCQADQMNQIVQDMVHLVGHKDRASGRRLLGQASDMTNEKTV